MPPPDSVSDSEVPPEAVRRLARRLRARLRGEVAFDAGSRAMESRRSRGAWAEPLGIVAPADEADLILALETAAEAGVALRVRGAGSAPCRDVGGALLVDCSRSLGAVTGFDAARGLIEVQPGLSLARLDAWLAPHGLRLPVDAPGAGHASIGGLVACDARLRGPDCRRIAGRIDEIDALFDDGSPQVFGPFGVDGSAALRTARASRTVSRLFEIASRASGEIARAWPREVDSAIGVRLDTFVEGAGRDRGSGSAVNLGGLLAGSHGELAVIRRVRLRLSRRPTGRWLVPLGCASVADALDRVGALQSLDPASIDLFDAQSVRAALEQAPVREAMRAAFGDRFGPQGAVLLVAFERDDAALPEPVRRAIVDACGARARDVLALAGPAAAALDAWRDRVCLSLAREGGDSGLRTPCDNRLPIAALARAHRRLEALFTSRGLRLRWFGAVGSGVLSMRAADEASARALVSDLELADAVAREVAALGGAVDGIGLDAGARDALLEPQYGPALARACRDARALFDPAARLSRRVPGAAARVVRIAPVAGRPAGSARPGDEPRSLPEMLGACDFGGACLGDAPGVMCPSFRATGRESDSPRGRAATARAALDGRFGPDGLGSDDVAAAFENCVACKACRIECPAAIDLSRVRAEASMQRGARLGFPRSANLLAGLVRRPRALARLAPLMRLRNASPAIAAIVERLTGLSRHRPWPIWQRRGFADKWAGQRQTGPAQHRAPAVLWVDSFNDRLAPEVLEAAARVMRAAGCEPVLVGPAAGDGEPSRALCCGRTWLAAGRIDEARSEAARTVRALAPYVARGVPVVGVEPACLYTMRDEYLWLLAGDAGALDAALADEARALARHAVPFETFVAAAIADGRLPTAAAAMGRAIVHPHCHQRAFGSAAAVVDNLAAGGGMQVEQSPEGCCGMGGSFGYEAAHDSVSRRMARSGPLAAIAASDVDRVVVADGIACRCQIADLAGRRALHSAEVIAQALDRDGLHGPQG